MVLAISDTRSIPLVLFAVVVPTAGIVVDPVPVFYVAPAEFLSRSDFGY